MLEALERMAGSPRCEKCLIDEVRCIQKHVAPWIYTVTPCVVPNGSPVFDFERNVVGGFMLADRFSFF